MSNLDSTTGTCPSHQEPIPGYRLLEQLGRGGYGEVWKTLAPGGVPKAIKLIYGGDSSRMATELRALNRIKDVRHPFLLSIERIEQRGGLLAIVTELGDKNLQQHFQDCLTRQLPGIPQTDLLPMMHDVADVLDYIYQEYALQHLDIKPANLLLFGRRLKVADFGLVKNIYERSASLVHGLTPTYAAPEIFDGQPTSTSDQYSLAILYQEMLTGILPFNGATAARLATQHLREKPDLSPLPASQQPIIARALSKDPQQRFSSCLEMVEELISAARRPAVTAAPRSEMPIPRELIAQPPTVAPSAASRPSVHTQPGALGDTRPPGTAPVASGGTPTIVVGIGGAAGKTLQRLRLRIMDRWGGVQSLPAFKILFLDGDHDALNDINKDQQAWADLETVPMPLRSSTEYREQGQVHRRWLSRRWLYNVPRNLSTEGFRPLGRLALLTNSNRVLAAVRSAISLVTAACPGTTPRVLLVASISGGTGSGMLVDMAYAVRHELATAGFVDAPVDGVLLHSTPVGTGRDKAILNAIATLSELDHYSAPGSFYPGEPLLEIPPFHGNNQTFTTTQLLHLGEDLDEPNWLRSIDNVAEHLYCRLLTNLDRIFSGPQSPAPGGRAAVDLVKLQQIGGYAGSFVDDLTRQLCVDMIDGWCGSELDAEVGERSSTSAATLLLNSMEHSQNARHQRLTADSEVKLQACGVDVEQLTKRTRETLYQELNSPVRDYLKAQFSEAIKAVSDDVPDHEVARLTIALQDQAIGLDFGERPSGAHGNTLFDMLYSRLASQAMPIAARYINWVCDLIDQPTGGVDAARFAAEAGRDCIRDLISILGKQTRERQTQQTNSRILLTSPPSPEDVAKASRGWRLRRVNTREPLAEKLIQHGLCSFDELVDVLVHLQLRSIEANLSSVIDQLLSMWQELSQFGNRLRSEINSDTDAGLPSRYERALRKWLLEHRPQLVHQLRTRVEHDILSGPRKLQRFLQQRCSYEETLGGPLRKHARRVVLNSMDQLLCIVLQHDSQATDGHELEINAALSEILSEPWTLNGGGGEGERAVLVVPAGTGKTTFQVRKIPNMPLLPIVSARTNNVAVCRERRQTPIQDVIQAIAHGQESVVTVAANLHTRIDVEWRTSTEAPMSGHDSSRTPAPWSEVPHTVPLN
ncbi:MAG: protein kinase [Planctomycetes bacterium]|nr:protein kinase [Planctomycetota bacterium]